MAQDERDRQRWKAQLEAAEVLGDCAAQTILRAHLAADHPDFAATEDAQAALREAAELARIARAKATANWGRRAIGSETSAGFRAAMREAGRGGMLP